ncbi:MAG: Riboflavin synthase [Planctomycetes bacterium]|nr:Riboflavin synthase [Planctomycetota bacterium]
MFAGIVAGTGEVLRAEPGAAGTALRLVVDVSCLARRPADGASVAVSGVCLTVVSSAISRVRKARRTTATFDVIGETIRKTTLGRVRAGDRVNLEGSLVYGDEIGGHLLDGHVQGTGEVVRAEPRGDQRLLTIRAPKRVTETLVPEGYVAVDGASLTVAALGRGTFSVALIPTTLRLTTLGGAERGTPVNLEGDPVGRRFAEWMRRRSRVRSR